MDFNLTYCYELPVFEFNSFLVTWSASAGKVKVSQEHHTVTFYHSTLHNMSIAQTFYMSIGENTIRQLATFNDDAMLLASLPQMEQLLAIKWLPYYLINVPYLYSAVLVDMLSIMGTLSTFLKKFTLNVEIFLNSWCDKFPWITRPTVANSCQQLLSYPNI